MPAPGDPSILRADVLDARARLLFREYNVNAAVDKELDSLFDEWKQAIANALIRQNLRPGELAEIARKALILSTLGKITATHLHRVEVMVGSLIKEVYKTEVYRTAYLLGGSTFSVNASLSVGFGRLSTDVIRAALDSPLPGIKELGTFKRMGKRIQAKMRRDLAEAVANGWDVDGLAAKWAKGRGAGTVIREAKMLATTSMFTASNNAQVAVYKKTPGVKGLEWEATFDTRTCMVCGSRHGKRYPKDSAPSMPAHWLCRCVWLPVFLDDKLNKFSAPLQAYAKPDGTTGFRQGDRSFEGWLRKESPETQRDFFPSERKWEVWKNRKLGLPDMISPDGSIKTDAEVNKLLKRRSHKGP